MECHRMMDKGFLVDLYAFFFVAFMSLLSYVALIICVALFNFVISAFIALVALVAVVIIGCPMR